MNNNEERHNPEFFNNLSYYKNDKPLPEGFTGKFTDPNFPPNKNSLLSLKPNGDPIDKSAYQRNSNAIYSDSIGWSRPEELFYGRDYKLFDGLTVDDITQGELGDCYYLSALAAVAKYPKMIRGLFKTDKVSENGCYEIVLHIDGKPQIVVIDDYIPCYNTFHMPCFAQPNGNEIWVLLMEKAFAKVNGGYLNIIGGLERESFEILTGFGSKYLTWFSYQFSNEEKLKKYRDYLFKELSQACKHKNHLIGLSTLPSAPQSMGLAGSHAYTVLDTITITSKDKKVDLVKIRNPHGHFEWNGDWSDDSPLWGPEEKAQVKLSKEDEGIFFMSLDDAMKYYYLLEICQLVIGGSVFYKIDKKDQINGQVFNIYIPNDCNFGVTVLRKLWRTNREQGNSVYLPTHISVAQYDPDHKRDKYHFFFNYSGMKSSSGLCSWCNRLKRGFYLIYVIQIHDNIKIDMSDGYEVKFDCSGSFKHMKMKSDLRENEYPLLKQLILQAEIELKKYDVYSSEYFYVNSNEIAGNGIGHYIVRPAEGAKYNFNGHFGFCFNYIPLAPYTKNQFNYTVDDDNFLVVLGLTKYESVTSTFNPKSFGFGFGMGYKNAPNIDINLNKYASKIVRTLKSCDTQKMGQWDKESAPSDYEQEEEDARKKVEDEANLDSSYNPYQQDKRKKNKKSDIDKIMKELERYTVIDQDELKKLFEEDSENYKKMEEEENKRKDDENKKFHDNQKKIYEQIKKAEEEMGKDKKNKDKKNYIDYFKGIPDKYLPDSMKYFLNNLSDIQDFKYDYKESKDGKTTKIKMVAKGRDKDGNLVNNVYNIVNNYNQVVNNKVINNDEDVSNDIMGDMHMDFDINNNNNNTNKKNTKKFFNGNPNIHILDNNQIYINNGNPNVNWDEMNKMMNLNFNNDMFNNMFPFNNGNFNFPGFNNNAIKEEVKKEKITIVNKNESKKEIVKPTQNKAKERNIEYKPKTETIYKKNVESQNVNNNNNNNINNNNNNNNNKNSNNGLNNNNINNNNKNSNNSFNNNNINNKNNNNENNNNNNNNNNNYNNNKNNNNNIYDKNNNPNNSINSNNLNNNNKINIREFEENERYDYEERRKEMIEKQKQEEGETTCCGGLFS